MEFLGGQNLTGRRDAIWLPTGPAADNLRISLHRAQLEAETRHCGEPFDLRP
jgi:hypothetical protein